MSLTPEQVAEIARLARLEINDEEAGGLAQSLSSIIDFVAQLEQADTEAVVPMAHPLDMAQRLREDAVTENVDRDTYQQNAPAVEDGVYIVPRVIE